MKPNLLLVILFLFQNGHMDIQDIHFLFHYLVDKKIFSKIPKRGDIVVFKTPEDNRTDYIKRVIGLPGDKLK